MLFYYKFQLITVYISYICIYLLYRGADWADISCIQVSVYTWYILYVLYIFIYLLYRGLDKSMYQVATSRGNPCKQGSLTECRYMLLTRTRLSNYTKILPLFGQSQQMTRMCRVFGQYLNRSSEISHFWSGLLSLGLVGTSHHSASSCVWPCHPKLAAILAFYWIFCEANYRVTFKQTNI